MTDEPESAVKSAESDKKVNGKPFAKGFDKRRWIKGRSPKSPEQREGEQILLAVIWEELSRVYDPATMKPKEELPEEIDALRLAVRQAIKKDFKNIMERVAGKVVEKHDLTSGGKALTWKDFISGNTGTSDTNTE